MTRVAVVLALLIAAGQGAAQQVSSARGAVLRGLDKVNGQIVDVELRAGFRGDVFGLQVDLADCRYPSNNPTGDAYAYLIVREADDQSIDFEGWMIASSPALSALDHPRYDVWVLRCITS